MTRDRPAARGLADLLPHRPPMRLLDDAEMTEEGVLLASQTIPTEGEVLRGHFPGFPIWPGALLLEAMAQTTAVFLLHERQGLRGGELPLLGAVDSRFLAPVFPGDRLRFRTELVRRLGDLGLFAVRAERGDGVVVARARIAAGIGQRAALETSLAGART